MQFTSKFARRALVIAATAAALAGAASCVPDATNGGGTTTTTSPTSSQAKPVLSPTSGPAGSFVDVAPPGSECSGTNGYTQLQAAITIPSSGVVIAQNAQFLGSPFSQYAGNDAFVHLRIPPGTASGTYNVFLSCLSYLDNYAFAPATFTVTAPA